MLKTSKRITFLVWINLLFAGIFLFSCDSYTTMEIEVDRDHSENLSRIEHQQIQKIFTVEEDSVLYDEFRKLEALFQNNLKKRSYLGFFFQGQLGGGLLCSSKEFANWRYQTDYYIKKYKNTNSEMYGVLDILGSGKKNVTLHTYGDICPQLLVFFENNSSSDYKRKGSKIRSFGNPLSTEGFITLNEFGDTRSLVQDSTYNYEFPAPSDLYISRHIPMN